MARKRVRLVHGTVVSDQETILRGVPVWHYGWGEQSGSGLYASDPAHWAAIRAAGLNAVRVVCFDPWQRSEGYEHYDLAKPADRDRFLAGLDRIVNLSDAHDLYAMINYHDEGRYDRDFAELFWRLVAPRYADRTHVFYELLNEPVKWFPEDYTEKVLADQAYLYRLVRGLAPNTHVVLLTFPNTVSLDGSASMVQVVEQLAWLDWSNESVGFHPYRTDGHSRPIEELRALVPVINTEMDLPASHSGCDLVQPMDGETWGFQTMERLGISWFAWRTDGPENLEHNFRNTILLRAREDGYAWQPDRLAPPAPPRRGLLDLVAEFRTTLPLRHLFRHIGARWSHAFVLVALAVAAAALDGLMLAMLIPMIRGIAAGSFDFLETTPLFSTAIGAAPAWLASYESRFLLVASVSFVLGLAKNVVLHLQHMREAFYYGVYSRSLAVAAFRRYLEFGKAYFDHASQGHAAAVLDYNHALLNLLQALLRVVSTCFVLAGYLAVLVLISWPLTLVTAAVFAALHFLFRSLVSRTAAVAAEINQAGLDIHKRTFDLFSSLPLFRARALEKDAAEQYDVAVERLRRLNLGIWRIQGLAARYHEVAVLTALLLLLTVVAVALGRGRPADIAVYLVFFFIARLALPRFSVFHEAAMEFGEKLPRARQFTGIFHDREKHIVPSGAAEFSGLRDALEFRNLSFSYPRGARALDRVSFEIRQGGITALVGASGAGKSTAVQLLLRFYDVPPGTLLLDGRDLRDFRIASWRRHVAYVGQEVILFHAPLRDNIAFGLDAPASEEQMARALRQARLDELVRSLPRGLDTVVGDRGVTLSAGERQRVAFARAFLHDAPILVLDEATSALDYRTERQIQDALEDVFRGRTVVAVAHRLSTIRRASHIVVLDRGRVVEQGALQELLDREGHFRQLWLAQNFY